jgi:hypothetical protein
MSPTRLEGMETTANSHERYSSGVVGQYIYRGYKLGDNWGNFGNFVGKMGQNWATKRLI